MPDCEIAGALVEISESCRILGALFYHPPAHPSVKPVLDVIEAEGLTSVWRLPANARGEEAIARMAQGLRSDSGRESVGMEFQRLFIGPDPLDAPPWGSVYLEEEGLLFGDSTRSLHDFLAKEGIALNTGQEEPGDHIGLMFWALALLAEESRIDALAFLLEEYFLTWADIYLARLAAATEHPFYQGLAQLAAVTLNSIKGAVIQCSNG